MNTDYFKNPVFYVSATVITILVIIGAIAPKQFGTVAGKLFTFTTANFGWFYLISVMVILIFLTGLAFSRFGKIRLGGQDERPEYPWFTWIGMLFSAGFGAGLVFWGVAEPMSHFFTTPFDNIEPQTEEAARVAMGYSFFHWGISQWSVFAIVGLVVGFMQFRKKDAGLISTAMEPITGKNKIVTNTIDSLAVIATVMGVATSLGLGILQMNGGLTSVSAVPNAVWVQLIITLVVFVAYMTSATTGLNKGIKYLSNVNLGLCILLLLFVLIAGPTVFILNAFTLGIGDYITNFFQYSLRLTPYEGDTWVREWTIFYWAWVIAWSPFVGAFVARVSRGRTIREFIFGVMVVPPVIACVWIAAFGGTALFEDLNRGGEIAEAVDNDITVALFQVYETVPLTTVMSLLSILLIFTFLVTSADSASYILGTMTSKGSLNPPMFLKLVWGVLISAIAAVLLLAGGLDALQTASLVAALPFTVIMLIMLAGIFKMLKKEPIPISKRDLRRHQRLENAAEEDNKE
ncbi:glycine/betaine ABC transporter permease [Halalkalibacillus sediminis]|uniref:Glycine/betaine ABC transporter permease n=1 Tax=Halalkalibacillus sediminis TaxID=2018042 RepID=A0A2I0QS05_9BACI|nr:BCCT family transporter [Halalkalibacillus sediminis]PKR77089.1 glycine/betaine ABC transporter permease [Halalkalibacillus sediminis]